MANAVTLKTEGFAELEAKLEEIGNEFAGKALYGSLMYASTPMYKDIKSNAPVAGNQYKRYMSSGQGEKTYVTTKRGKQRKGKSKRARRGTGVYKWQDPGTLKDNVRRRRLTKGDAKRGSGANIAIYIRVKGSTYESAFYWYFVEYGTSSMPAQPFIRPAFDKHSEGAIDRMKKGLAKRIDKYTT